MKIQNMYGEIVAEFPDTHSAIVETLSGQVWFTANSTKSHALVAVKEDSQFEMRLNGSKSILVKPR